MRGGLLIRAELNKFSCVERGMRAFVDRAHRSDSFGNAPLAQPGRSRWIIGENGEGLIQSSLQIGLCLSSGRWRFHELEVLLRQLPHLQEALASLRLVYAHHLLGDVFDAVICRG